MTINPLVTVVIPIFNGEKYVDTCLRNILSQSYKHLDIVVVDDKSTDKTVEKVRNYPVRLIMLEKNGGLSVARNTGVDAAKGEYVHFMDVDDIVNEDYYTQMVQAITSTNADIACGGIIHQRATYKTHRFKKQKEYTILQDKLTVTYVGKWGYSCRYLFRLQMLKDNNLRFEEGRLIEDLPYSFAAVCYAKKLVVVPGAEYTYVFTPNSITTSKDDIVRQRRRADKKHARNKIISFAKQNGNFKIPGVNKGVWRYILRKVLVKLGLNS